MALGIGIAFAGILLLASAFAFGRKSADPLKAVLVSKQEMVVGLPAGFPDLHLSVLGVPVQNPYWLRLALTNAGDRYISPQDFAESHISAVMSGAQLLCLGNRSADARLAKIEREPVQVHWGPGTLGPDDLWEAEFLFDQPPDVLWMPPQGRHRIALITEASGENDPGAIVASNRRPSRDFTHIGAIGTWVGAALTAAGIAVSWWQR